MKRFVSSSEALNLLKRAGCSTSILRHCLAVSCLAVQLAWKLKRRDVKIDVRLVEIGGLLHDIGRSKTHGIDHAVVGADIVRSFNLPSSVVRIVERHTGAGILAEEAEKLGLPSRDFIPETLEEKVVSYADKLIEGNRVVSFDAALRRFSEEFGESHVIVNRFIRIHTELFQALESSTEPC